jgi:nucleotide-binding universal stress UspA family protein
MTEPRKKILVPVDFEGAAERALETARWLAGPLRADLVLLHVHDRRGFEHPELSGEMVEHIQDTVEKGAIKALADLAVQHGVKETIFRHGDTAEQILDVARHLGPAMVVMGTHGRRGLNRLLLGSVAAHVMRDCPVPLITVRASPGDVGT